MTPSGMARMGHAARIGLGRCQAFCLSLVALLAVPSSVLAEGGLPGTMLAYAPAPRSLALGKAFTGLADDVQAVYFNPGGLFQLNANEVILAHSQLYGAQMEYIAYALPTRDWGTFAINLLSHWAGGMESRTPDNYRYQNFFYLENSYLMSYCYNPTNYLGLGATAKIVSKNMAQYSDLGMGADLGILVTKPGPLSFGLFCQNLIQPELQLADLPEKYQRNLKAGLSLRLLGGRAILAADASMPLLYDRDNLGNPTNVFTPRLTPRGGAEFELVPTVLYQRIGVDPNDLSLGLGIHKTWGKMSMGVDYAILLHHQSNYRLAPTHKAGLYLDFSGFRVWVDATPAVFSPTVDNDKNILWMDVRIVGRAKPKRWQVLIKNNYGEVVRTFQGWDSPPLRMSWDGLDDAGRLVADGQYRYDIVVVDVRGNSLEYAGLLTEIRTRGPRGKVEIRTGE